MNRMMKICIIFCAALFLWGGRAEVSASEMNMGVTLEIESVTGTSTSDTKGAVSKKPMIVLPQTGAKTSILVSTIGFILWMFTIRLKIRREVKK